jgi:succinate dehydrogenase flavin-adding protein (antitoxin of CptAB toxin-antitoxin module)
MFRIVFLLLFSFTTGLLNAQYTSVDIPRPLTTTTGGIASYIKNNYKTDLERTRAIYTWITTNIRYSTDSANSINMREDKDAKVTFALRRRKGVCENYAAIFNDIAVKAGLTSFVISGYTKQGGTIDKEGHSWLTVLIDKDWHLFDPTWDEGREMNFKYFMMPPLEFVTTHMPYDPQWQLVNYPITRQQFENSNSHKNKATSYFNYSDTITAFLQMDSLHQLQSSISRIQREEISNKLVKDNFNYLKMHVEIINQDKDVDLYNSSVAGMNEATVILNNFIQYRNNKFMPEKTDSEIQTLLDGIDTKLQSAIKNLDEIDRSTATFTIGTQHVRERVQALVKRIKDQKDFVAMYTATEKNTRQSLFYK